MVMPWETSILDGAYALLLRAKLAITGDTTIAGDLNVSGKIVGGAIPIENLSDVDTQSFNNIIDNGDFKLWSAGIAAAPDGWVNNLLDNIDQEDTIIKIGSYSVKLTPSATWDKLEYPISNYAYYIGRTITFGCWVYSSSAASAKLRIEDDTIGVFSSAHTGLSKWEWLTVTHTVNAGTVNLECELYPDNNDGDDVAYYSGAIMVEGSICPAFSPKPLSDLHTYGEMYISNNSNATVIETPNTPIALRQISSGLQKGFIFDAGSTGAVSWYADYSGTVAGSVLVSCTVAHNLTTGDIVTIRGTTNYNGIFEIVVVNNDQFYIIDTWVADDGASDWDKGASLTAQAGAAGVYTSTWQMTTAPAGACVLCFKVNINETPQDKSTACRDMAINDNDNNSSTCLISIVEGDIVWLSVESDSTSDITNAMGNMNLERL